MRGLAAMVVAAVLAVGGCAGTGKSDNGGEGDGAPPARGEPGGAGPGGADPAGSGLVELRILADESLTEAFGAVEQGFEQHHPNVEVVVTYADGGNLARRIAGGEPADVFATDDLFAMRTVTDAAKAARPEEWGGGRLTVTVLAHPAAPAAAASFVDFLREGDGRRILIETGLLRP
ncbi:extracellular solute-binding protein [Actinoplanes sp. NEAU-A12]|uniref:Extracellular solute-binding protein n=1 Tax=Actinoplanes sandaracinus TaxID=3045177 RepID=A0ABT6WNJ1_9ACTN|nr:extracellular solute-binding protein [Actinoplanes sandaracinus]MDI6101303.1 extracellular solute-binding protein [Actinoplanes sandaracinus]